MWSMSDQKDRGLFRALTSRNTSQDENLNGRTVEIPRLRKQWGTWTILAFAVTTLTTWETTGTLLQLAFPNGGAPSLIFGCLFMTAGLSCMYASLGEMASMIPVAGAQYIWSAQMVPSRFRAFVSFFQGCITAVAWQTAVASSAFLIALQIEGAVLLHSPKFEYKDWHLCLTMLAALTIACAVIILGRQALPSIMITLAIIHILLGIVFIVVLLIGGRNADANFVWENVRTPGGWGNDGIYIGIGVCIGLFSISFSLVGSESCAHLAEETDNAQLNIPRAMVYGTLINAVIAFSFLVAAFYAVSDSDSVIDSNLTGAPLLEILRQANVDPYFAMVLWILEIIPLFGSMMINLASSSRLTWAFARDGAFWKSEYFSAIHPDFKIPVRAIILTYVINVLLSLIVIASPTAFNAVVSFTALAFYVSYLIAIALFLYHRLTTEHIAYGPWKLGRLGVPLNIISVVYGCFSIIFLSFPLHQSVTWATLNWAIITMVVVILLVCVFWFCWAKKNFRGPIVLLTVENHSDGNNGGTFNIFSREKWITE